MDDVFAPWCPTCRSRVLLGCEDIVRFTAGGDVDHAVVLRCSCGELLAWNQKPPPPSPPRAAVAMSDDGLESGRPSLRRIRLSARH